jgi:hypothetical protein
MNDGTRRAVAYIAGRLHDEREASAVLDLATGRHAWFEGTVGPKVAVYDHSRNALVGGVPTALYDAGTHHYVNLEMSGDSFTGFDHASNHHFGGRVVGGRVWIFDCEPERRYSYELVVAPGESGRRPVGESRENSVASETAA